jgi:hypothetical protein
MAIYRFNVHGGWNKETVGFIGAAGACLFIALTGIIPERRRRRFW